MQRKHGRVLKRLTAFRSWNHILGVMDINKYMGKISEFLEHLKNGSQSSSESIYAPDLDIAPEGAFGRGTGAEEAPFNETVIEEVSVEQDEIGEETLIESWGPDPIKSESEDSFPVGNRSHDAPSRVKEPLLTEITRNDAKADDDLSLAKAVDGESAAGDPFRSNAPDSESAADYDPFRPKTAGGESDHEEEAAASSGSAAQGTAFSENADSKLSKKRAKARKRRQRKKNRRVSVSLIVICILALLIIAAGVLFYLMIFTDTFYEKGKGNNDLADLKSSVVYVDSVDGKYEVATIIKVKNLRKDKPLTSVEVTVLGKDEKDSSEDKKAGEKDKKDGKNDIKGGEKEKEASGKDKADSESKEENENNEGLSFRAYGYVPPGKEALMAGVWYSEKEPPKKPKFKLTTMTRSFSPDAPEKFTPIAAQITSAGTTVSMEIDHDKDGMAVKWDDENYAQYEIEIVNENEVSFGSGQLTGIAVVYDGKKLKKGDIFYNKIQSLGAGVTVEDVAVLPKNIGDNSKAELFILPKYRAGSGAAETKSYPGSDKMAEVDTIAGQNYSECSQAGSATAEWSESPACADIPDESQVSRKRSSGIADSVAGSLRDLFVAEASAAPSSDYYAQKRVYTEGIYVNDGIYVEPCFTHFRKKSKKYPALMIKGDVPKGTKYRLHKDSGSPEYAEWKSKIPKIKGLGVYRIDMKMPGRKMVTFQAEIVLEGIKPCRIVSYTYEIDKVQKEDKKKKKKKKEKTEVQKVKVAARAFEFINEHSRITYNIDRNETVSQIPSHYKVEMHRSGGFYKYTEVPEIKQTNVHKLTADISGGALKNTHKNVPMRMYIYEDGWKFASHKEMVENRTKYGMNKKN